MTVWTSAITPGHPILDEKLFKNLKIEKRVKKNFPLSILGILCIFGSIKAVLEAALPESFQI